MGPVLARLQGQLPEEGFAAVSSFLDNVVESLKQQGSGGVAAELSEQLAGALPAVKALAGLSAE